MAKVFEDYFSEFQMDMLSICLEYVENLADEIYIHCSCEQGIVSCNVFFRINGTIVKRSKLNDALPEQQKKNFLYDISDIRQQKLISLVNEDIKRLEMLCKQNNHPVPTELKIQYNVALKSMKSYIGYNLLYTNDPEKRLSQIFDAWFTEVCKENEG
jgi:hypothetical protein